MLKKYNLNGLVSQKNVCGLDLLIDNLGVQVWACLDSANKYFGQVEILMPSDEDKSGWTPYYYYDFLNPDSVPMTYKGKENVMVDKEEYEVLKDLGGEF